ncbi:bacillithiol system redox-active protein YtxJ [Filibacter tadaridae]|uniref:Bacillithiol system protein YtxJ n=1 Tax=Filibacter tadaridae TaxID=2483811 RepID=A0A3P5X337_9BACL|nr:bacillithiol system redox-active protein YtxJ [Filibacter tadaridae]VDC21604.1 hypothetical protein FILTAD_00608 [Filibacter tadaridae]
MKEIQTVDEWQNVLKSSNEQPQFMMKHSSTCPVSAAAYKAYSELQTEVPKSYLIVQDSKPLSNEIEKDLSIQHESPQLFLLKDGKAIWQATHYAISGPKLKKAVEEFC